MMMTMNDSEAIWARGVAVITRGCMDVAGLVRWTLCMPLVPPLNHNADSYMALRGPRWPMDRLGSPAARDATMALLGQR